MDTSPKPWTVIRKVLRGTLAALLCAAAFSFIPGTLFLLYGFVNCPFNDQPFTVQTWHDSTPNQRARMAADLVAHYLPQGTERTAVVELLGPPSHEKGDTIRYWLGSWSFSPGGHDDSFVFIDFDPQGRLAHAEIDGY